MNAVTRDFLSDSPVNSNSEFEFEIPKSKVGEPAWALALLFPVQGRWTDEEFLRFDDRDRQIELANGCFEFLPFVTMWHATIVMWLLKQLSTWNQSAKAGELLTAPLPLLLFPGTIREPDILLLPKPKKLPRPKYPASALLLMEVVSEGEEARQRDYIAKRADYAKAGIPEYWIIDPIEKAVTVLKLEGAEYSLHGRFEKTQTATSATLSGFAVECAKIWALESEC
jgi:Uma2 family endonuclease